MPAGSSSAAGARGLPANVAKAFEFYSKAAAAGEPSAFAQLGHMYAHARGVVRNPAAAFAW